MKKTKRLPITAKTFKANSNEYLITDTMIIERWKYQDKRMMIIQCKCGTVNIQKL